MKLGFSSSLIHSLYSTFRVFAGILLVLDFYASKTLYGLGPSCLILIRILIRWFTCTIIPIDDNDLISSVIVNGNG